MYRVRNLICSGEKCGDISLILKGLFSFALHGHSSKPNSQNHVEKFWCSLKAASVEAKI